MTTEKTIPVGLTAGEPPRDSQQQFLAWGIVDRPTRGLRKPRWMIVQYYNHKRSWIWSVPGKESKVKILAWAPLSQVDYVGAAYAFHARFSDSSDE